MHRKLPIALLVAGLTAACTSTGSSSEETLPTAPVAGHVNACSILPETIVASKIGGRVTEVSRLTRANFISPPPGEFAACAYRTSGRYGELILWVQPMGREQYEARFAHRDTPTTKVPGLGEDALFHGCGGLTVYSGGRILQLGVQYGVGPCGALERSLVSLARVGLRNL
jgi:hypothetical protein